MKYKESVNTLKFAHQELLTAIDYMLSILAEWFCNFEQANFLLEEEKQLVQHSYNVLNTELSSSKLKLSDFKNRIDAVKNDSDLNKLISLRNRLYASLRISLSQFSSLITCLNWQAPSIKSSSNTRIGIEKYPVKADWNDYKRDRSGDTFFCESMIENNIIKTENTGVKPVLNIFNSGMAGFTAIIYYLINEKIVKNKILASSQIYVESRLLLKAFFGNELVVFEENNTETIINKIIINKPSVVFFEPMSNTNNLRLFDVVKIVKEVSKKYSEEIYYIIDVTCLLGFENIFDDFKIPEKTRIILHGSMLKSPQLGLERTNAGFVQSFNLGENSKKILDYRTLSGTTMQDYTSNALPFTTKSLLQQRMKIIQTNTLYLAQAILDEDPELKVINEVVYPKLKIHPDYEYARDLDFVGSFFNIKFVEHLNNDNFFEIFTSLMIEIAKKDGCDVIHGASFGFNQTSIYYSVGWDEPENHYIRISPGTETPYEIEKIKNVLVQTFEIFKEKINGALENKSGDVK